MMNDFWRDLYPIIWVIASVVWVVAFGIATIVRFANSENFGGEVLAFIVPFVVDGIVCHFIKDAE